MSSRKVASRALHYARVAVTSIAMFQFSIGPSLVSPAPPDDPHREHETTSPIKHVIVIIGENRSFDHVFATYKPKGGQLIDNLLSKRIIKEDGSPGPNFGLAVQKSAVDSAPSPYELSPRSKAPYSVLPPVLAGGPTQPFLASLAEAQE